jgi:YfiH family protein
MRNRSASLEIPSLGIAAPRAYLSLKAHGDMGFGTDTNSARRSVWLGSVGFDGSRSISADLVHSRKVIVVSAPEHARGVEADGLVAPGTLAKGSALVITVADCMPIFMYDRVSGAFSLLHSGWRGTGILAVAVREMAARFGTTPKDLSIYLGPGIGSCCYTVDGERARGFADEFGESCVVWDKGRPRLDLAEANKGLARRLGVGTVASMDACTSCDPRFGSYRREGHGTFTRMAAVIGHPGSG